MTRRGRAVFAILIGAVAAAVQMYVDVSYGPYVALLVVSLFTPTIDRIFGPRTARLKRITSRHTRTPAANCASAVSAPAHRSSAANRSRRGSRPLAEHFECLE
jgi:hypothetical protein